MPTIPIKPITRRIPAPTKARIINELLFIILIHFTYLIDI